jgi:hypothetical protein
VTVLANKKRKATDFWGIVSRIILVLATMYFVSFARHYFFPDDMTRLEKMLRHSVMDGYQLAIDRQSKGEIVLTVYNGGQSIVTEIYEDVVIESDSAVEGVKVSAYSINKKSDDSVYMTRTRIEADPDLERVRRLEVSVCDRIVHQDGKVHYEGHEPVYECMVPIRKIVCHAAESSP